MAVDSIPKINPDLAFNLCYNSLTYWYRACGISDSILVQERAKIKVYEKITGISASSLEDLEQINKIKVAELAEKDLRLESLEKDLKSVKRRKNAWKVGTFVFVPTALVGGVILGVKIAK